MDIFDYLIWRGDLTFKTSPVCEIDGAIFAMASYIDYDLALADGEFTEPLPFKYVAESYLDMDDSIEVKMGVIFPMEKIIKMLKEMLPTDRFSKIYISDFVNDINVEKCYQFAAMTFHLDDGSKVVSFRGTDDTVIGWREDCNLTFMREIPSQKMAYEYLLKTARKYPTSPIYVCGHSKGGNLAVYAAVRAGSELSSRIRKVYNFDGPGHSADFVASDEFKAVSDVIETVVPQSSLVGTMFNGGKFQVASSNYKGPYQHDLYSWELAGPKFKKLLGLTARTEKYHTNFNAIMENMTNDEKEKFVDVLFDCIAKAGLETVSQASEKKLKSLHLIIKNLGDISKEKKDLMIGMVFKMLEIRREERDADEENKE